MFGVTTSEDYQPVGWMGRYPVHVTILLVAAHVVCLVAACLVMAADGGGALAVLMFDSAQVWESAQVWRLVTYAFVHSPQAIIWFAVEMYMLFVFGREVERFLGRRTFIILYAVLIVAPVLILTLMGLGWRSVMAGSSALHFGVFIAFATVYPQVEMLLRLTAKWIAVILSAAYTLQLLAYHGWTEMIVLWTSIALGFFFVRLRGVGPELVWWNQLKGTFAPKPKFKVVPAVGARARADSDDVHESIDPILEKISKSGVGSLTPGERQALDRARARLLNEK